jgi:hypothetical protein
MLTKVSWLCLFLAVILLVWGGFWALTSEEHRDSNNALIVEITRHDLGEQLLGSHMLEVRVRNTGSRPHRIIGIPSG